MDRETAQPITKHRLQRYRALKLEIGSQTERLMRERSALEATGTKIDGMPKSNYAVDKMAKGIAKVVELENLINKNLPHLQNEALFLEQGIQRVSNPTYREILRMRYLDVHTWDYISEKLCYVTAWLHVLHNRALEDIYEITKD